MYLHIHRIHLRKHSIDTQNTNPFDPFYFIIIPSMLKILYFILILQTRASKYKIKVLHSLCRWLIFALMSDDIFCIFAQNMFRNREFKMQNNLQTQKMKKYLSCERVKL